MNGPWEVTLGRGPLDWSASRHWWVMTWTKSADGRWPAGPYLVHDFDRMGKVVTSVPRASVQFFKPEGAEPEIRVWHLPDADIWARLPAAAPEAPNVKMEFLS